MCVLHGTMFSHCTILHPKVCVKLDCILYVKKCMPICCQYSRRTTFLKDYKQSKKFLEDAVYCMGKPLNFSVIPPPPPTGAKTIYGSSLLLQ